MHYGIIFVKPGIANGREVRYIGYFRFRFLDVEMVKRIDRAVFKSMRVFVAVDIVIMLISAIIICGGKPL